MLQSWRIIDIINWAESYFKEKGFENPRIEIEWLLRSVLQCERLDLYLRFEEPLSKSQLSTLRNWIKRRILREPIQYITGVIDFYGREFFINEGALIPRPETERLIDIALSQLKNSTSPNILDVGTGSGCIATTLSLEIPNANVLGVDISEEALDLAKKNKEKLFAVNVSFEKIDILKEIPTDNFDVMISNPPYITKEEINFLDKDVRNFEPIIALTDHKDGLTFYRRFADIALDVVKSGGWIILEVGQKSHPEKAKTIFNKMGFNNVKLINDYNGDNRILLIQV